MLNQAVLTLQYILMINNVIENNKIFSWNQASLDFKDTLYGLDVSKQCPISSIENFNITSQQIRQIKLRQTKMMSLQIKNDFIVIYDYENQQIIDFFRCGLNVYFFIQKDVDGQQPLKKQLQSLQNNHSIIRFGTSALQTQKISLIIESRHNKVLEQFGIELGKRAIIQQGFHQKFKPIRKIRKGLTSDVFKALRYRDSVEIVTKACNKQKMERIITEQKKKTFMLEVQILTHCNHPNICKYEGVFQTENSLYIIMENYSRSLSYLLTCQKHSSKETIVGLMKKLLQAIIYLNDNGIVHRDIKLENIMIKKIQDTIWPVLIDFGMADYFRNEDFIFQKCGTPGYMAPQLFQSKPANPQKCDIFSLAVVFHLLLFKKPVFRGTTAQQVLSNNSKINLILAPELNEYDVVIKDLLLKMLQPQNEKRISAEEALQHQLFLSNDPITLLKSQCTADMISSQKMNYD